MVAEAKIDDVLFAPLEQHQKDASYTCNMILIKGYHPAMQEDIPYYSAYYVASNSLYHKTHQLCKKIQALGVTATAHPYIKLKSAALHAGGIFGINQLYYHPIWQSRVALSAIAIKGILPQEKEATLSCKKCKACIQACPGGAISQTHGFDRDKCIRNHFMDNAPIPTSLWGSVTGIFGCEICQDVCPLNHAITRKREATLLQAFDLKNMLCGNIKYLENIIGKNYAKKQVLKGQALLYIGAQKIEGYEDDILHLSRETGHISAYANWAKKQILSD